MLPSPRQAAERLPFTAIYNTVGFKEAEAEVFLSSPITAKIMEVERFTSAQDRFNVTTQRSVNKVQIFVHTGAEYRQSIKAGITSRDQSDSAELKRLKSFIRTTGLDVFYSIKVMLSFLWKVYPV